MLSTKQQKLKQQSKSKEALAEFVVQLEEYKVRLLNSNYDADRVAELWANLSMIQQMQGNDHWYQACNKAKLDWADYISKLVNSKATKVIVFENENIIFGFAFMSIEVHEDPDTQTKHPKAVIREIYLEPAFKKFGKDIKMAHAMQNILSQLQIEYVEFAVKDLDL